MNSFGVICTIMLAILVITVQSRQINQAPKQFIVDFYTTVQQGDGTITLNVTRSFSPNGVDRFYQLLTLNSTFSYYEENGFFRVLPGFVVQFGINGDPRVSGQWENANIPDDPVIISNTVGTIAYADAGPNTRTTQLYINYGDNSNLDGLGFTPFGYVLTGMDVANQIYSGYGQNPDQSSIYSVGNSYLKENFPLLDYIISTKIVSEEW